MRHPPPATLRPQARLSAAQRNRVRRPDARQPAAGRPARADPRSAALRAPAARGERSAPGTSARIASAKGAGLGTFWRLDAGQRHSRRRGPSPRWKRLDPPSGPWDL